mmetsp:Transcript_3330/g.6746  ORF Transcript_3330/g.6746 Transcript_3330/m.6746 type:complete len:236 (-) Transcript_3330:75-782(-)
MSFSVSKPSGAPALSLTTAAVRLDAMRSLAADAKVSSVLQTAVKCLCLATSSPTSGPTATCKECKRVLLALALNTTFSDESMPTTSAVCERTTTKWFKLRSLIICNALATRTWLSMMRSITLGSKSAMGQRLGTPSTKARNISRGVMMPETPWSSTINVLFCPDRSMVFSASLMAPLGEHVKMSFRRFITFQTVNSSMTCAASVCGGSFPEGRRDASGADSKWHNACTKSKDEST